MKKILLAFVIVIFSVFISPDIDAHSGRTDSSGGHNCRVGSCAGTYHYHNGGPAYTPSYSYKSVTTYSCSKYGSMAIHVGNGKCECASGYVFGENILGEKKCISKDTYCENKYGYNASYDILSDKCECDYGNVFQKKFFGSGIECVSCSSKYGYNSNYNSFSKSCECDDGYVLYNEECTELETVCQSRYGYNAEGVDGTKCNCKDGYKWDLSETYCIQMEKEILPSTSFKSLDDVCQKYYGKNSFYNNRLENCICSNGKIPIGDEICDSSIIIPTVQNQEKMKCGFRAHQTTKNNCECDSGFVFVSPDDSENSNCRATRIHKTTKRKRTYTKPQSSKRLIRATTNRRFNSKYK